MNIASDSRSCVRSGRRAYTNRGSITGNQLFQHSVHIRQIRTGCIGIHRLQLFQHINPQPVPLSQHISVCQNLLNRSSRLKHEVILGNRSLGFTILVEVSQDFVAKLLEVALRSIHQLLLLIYRREVRSISVKLGLLAFATLHGIEETMEIASDHRSRVSGVRCTDGRCVARDQLFQNRISVSQISVGYVGIGCLQMLQHINQQPVPLSQHIGITKYRLNGLRAIQYEVFLGSVGICILIEVSQEFLAQLDKLSIGLNLGLDNVSSSKHQIGDRNHQLFSANIQSGIVVPTNEVPLGRIEVTVLYVELAQFPCNVVPTVDPAGILTLELLCAFLGVRSTCGGQLEAELNLGQIIDVGNVNIKYNILLAGDVRCGNGATLAVTERKSAGSVSRTTCKASVLNLSLALPVLLENTLIPLIAVDRNNDGVCILGFLCGCADDDISRQRQNHQSCQ